MATTVTYKGNTLTTVNNQTRTLNTAGKYLEDDITLVDTTGGSSPSLQTKTVTYTPTESQQTATITPDSGYDGLDEVDITVNAVSDTYVGSGIDRRTSSDLTVSGATVTAPAGYYASSASQSVASGTAGTPTASKGAVSGNSVSVTPSVTNTTGYITGSTINGTAVTVSASELVSGTLSVTSSGTKDVTNYASASIPAGTEGTPVATKGAVSSNSISVTPSVTNSSGFIVGGTQTGTAVTVSASELVSGTLTISANGTSDVTNYASVSVNVPSSEFIITLSYNSSTDMWEPDCTYTEALAAYNAGKTIAFMTDGIEAASGEYVSSQGFFYYGVTKSYNDFMYTNKLIDKGYVWSSTGIEEQSALNQDFYDTSNADAQPTDVVNGKKFYNANGYQIGTYSGSGGTSVAVATKKQINFIDYDGTILYSYTSSEWAEVTSLPSNPAHTGLVAQGWNWTKAQIDAQLTAMPDGDVWVGQMYITQSGDTEIDVRFADSARLSPILTICVNGTITVDWGDGTTADTVTGTSLATRQAVPHTYATTGDYTMIIHVVSGSFQFYGTAAYTILRKNTTQIENGVYASRVQAVRLGSGVTSIGTYAFFSCYSLASITIPSNVTSIGNYSFSSCYSLASITIPSNVTSIGTYAFSCCYSLASITIPSNVTSIGTRAFSSCPGVAEYHLLPTTPPTLETNAFYNIVSDCVIYVPAGSLEAYQTATNWSTYADYMQEE